MELRIWRRNRASYRQGPSGCGGESPFPSVGQAVAKAQGPVPPSWQAAHPAKCMGWGWGWGGEGQASARLHSELGAGVWEALWAQWSEKGYSVPRKCPSSLTLLFCAQVGKERTSL